MCCWRINKGRLRSFCLQLVYQALWKQKHWEKQWEKHRTLRSQIPSVVNLSWQFILDQLSLTCLGPTQGSKVLMEEYVFSNQYCCAVCASSQCLSILIFPLRMKHWPWLCTIWLVTLPVLIISPPSSGLTVGLVVGLAFILFQCRQPNIVSQQCVWTVYEQWIHETIPGNEM